MAERDPSVAALSDRLSRRQWLTSAAALAVTPAALARPMAAEAQPSGKPPKPGGTSVWAAETDPVALNPITNSNFSSTQGFEHCYESLTAFDAKPKSCRRWPSVGTRPIRPRTSSTFAAGSSSTTGASFTAEDVKYTFDIVLDPKGPAFWRGNFDQVDRVEVVDRHTVKFITKAPFPPLLGALAILRSSAIIPKGAMEKLKLETQVVGTGPYRLVEYIPKSHMKLGQEPRLLGQAAARTSTRSRSGCSRRRTRAWPASARVALDYAFLTPEGVQRLRNEPRLVVTSRPRTYLYAFVINRAAEAVERPARAPGDQSWPPTARRSSRRCSRAARRWPGRSRSASATGTSRRRSSRQVVPSPTSPRRRQLLREAGVPDGHADRPAGDAVQSELPRSGRGLRRPAEADRSDVKIRQVEQGVFLKEVAPPELQLRHPGQRLHGASRSRRLRLQRLAFADAERGGLQQPEAGRAAHEGAHDDRPRAAEDDVPGDPADPPGRRAQRLARQRQRHRGTPELRQGLRAEPLHVPRVGAPARWLDK